MPTNTAARFGAQSSLVSSNAPMQSDAAAAGLLFVGGGDKPQINVFPEFGGTRQIATISKGLSGSGAVTLDRAGNLFDTAGPNNTVVEYAPPYTGAPIASFSTGTNSMDAPTGVTVGPDDTVYVSEIVGGAFGAGQVVVFPPHSSVISRTLSATFAGFMTTDAKGDLFVAVEGTSDVEEFKPGSTQGTRLGLKGLLIVGGVTFDTTGNLLVANEVCTVSSCIPEIDVFAPGSKTRAQSIGSGRFVSAEGLALSRNGTRLFVGDSETQQHPSTVFELAYPSGKLIARIENPGTTVAVTR
ncbi:MAG: hypothetical protein ABI282_02350 [Candidatus Baltobacteraceae bacterium]